jgi:hypothetical protein
VVAWFDVVVGEMIAGLWAALAATRQLPEVAEGRRDIWSHIAAELATAVLLVGAGSALLLSDGDAATVLAGVAAGALAYTAVNSPGYYADRRQWAVVAMFGAIAAAAVATVVVLVRTAVG